MSQLSHPIWDFPGGLFLDDHKADSNRESIREIALAPTLVIPLQQHIGAAAEACVQVGDSVRAGQLIGRASDYVSANIHSPADGVVEAIETRAVAHPSGLKALCVVIATEPQQGAIEHLEPLPDYAQCEPANLRERLRWAGIVGLGGAVFPTSVKSNTTGKPIDTLVINGAECEPYITCDDRLMREQADKILAGARILAHILKARQILIGVEDNKPEAIDALLEANGGEEHNHVAIRSVPSKYPSGGEKQLIHLLTGIEVPSQGLPSDVGVVCQNVATCAAVADAVLQGLPMTHRIVTLTGSCTQHAGNYKVAIGTPLAHLIEQAGGLSHEPERTLMGGPMMGFAIHDRQNPITKGSNCFIATDSQQMPAAAPAQPCIRCGRCADACPVSLLPQQMYWHARARDFDKTQDYHLFDCIECGCCAHVCPSNIPLVHYYRFAKTEIWASERDKAQADLARRRHEFRDARLARLEAERKARLRKKKEVLDKKPAGAKDPKKAAIEAAMKRVAAKKAAVQKEES